MDITDNKQKHMIYYENGKPTKNISFMTLGQRLRSKIRAQKGRRLLKALAK